MKYHVTAAGDVVLLWVTLWVTLCVLVKINVSIKVPTLIMKE